MKAEPDTCIYYEESIAIEEQRKYCNQGQHSQPRLGFCNEDGEEFSIYNICLVERESSCASSHSSRAASPGRVHLRDFYTCSGFQDNDTAQGLTLPIGDPPFQANSPAYLSHPALR